MMGRYFGYPDCCISNFVRLIAIDKAPGTYMWDMYGFKDNGYIQCHSCQIDPKPVKRKEEYLSIAQSYVPGVDLAAETLP